MTMEMDVMMEREIGASEFWPRKKLKLIAPTIQYGYTGKTVEASDYRYLRITDIQNEAVDWSKTPYSDVCEKESKKYLLNKGDIVFARTGATAGKSYLFQDDELSIFASYLIRVVVDKKLILPEFLYAYFQSPDYWAQIFGNIVGAAQPNFNGQKLGELEIPLPPLPEQQRIVQKLDALFARIDEAITLAERAIESIQSLLPAALNEVFAESEQYEPVSLMKHVEFIGGSQPPKDDFVYQEGPGLVRLIQIRDYKSDDHKVFIQQDSTKKFCKADDVMIGRYGPPVFQILRGLEGAYNVALMKAVPDEQFLSKEYLFWFLQNPNIQNYIIGISQRSAGQSGVNKDALEKYGISLLPLPIQNYIVRYISGLVKQIEAIELSFARKLAQLQTLKQSLLDAAFTANL